MGAQAISGSDFPVNVNLALALVVGVALLLFALEVSVNLAFAYFDSVRANKTFFKVPLVGLLFRSFARWSATRKSWEPIVVYDVEGDLIRLLAAKRRQSPWRQSPWRQSASGISGLERQYFLKVMAETLGFAVVHMRLDVIPGTFLEFVLRLGFAFHKVEEETQECNKSLNAIAGGDISMLAEWSLQQHQRLQRSRGGVGDRKGDTSDRLEGFFAQVERRLARETRRARKRRQTLDADRLRDLEAGLSHGDTSSRSSDSLDSPRASSSDTAKETDTPRLPSQTPLPPLAFLSPSCLLRLSVSFCLSLGCLLTVSAVCLLCVRLFVSLGVLLPPVSKVSPTVSFRLPCLRSASFHLRLSPPISLHLPHLRTVSLHLPLSPAVSRCLLPPPCSSPISKLSPSTCPRLPRPPLSSHPL